MANEKDEKTPEVASAPPGQKTQEVKPAPVAQSPAVPAAPAGPTPLQIAVKGIVASAGAYRAYNAGRGEHLNDEGRAFDDAFAKANEAGATDADFATAADAAYTYRYQTIHQANHLEDTARALEEAFIAAYAAGWKAPA